VNEVVVEETHCQGRRGDREDSERQDQRAPSARRTFRNYRALAHSRGVTSIREM